MQHAVDLVKETVAFGSMERTRLRESGGIACVVVLMQTLTDSNHGGEAVEVLRREAGTVQLEVLKAHRHSRQFLANVTQMKKAPRPTGVVFRYACVWGRG